MQRFAIVVTIKLKPGTAEEFKPLILENGTSAVKDEQDCHLFHIMQDNSDPDTFIFYEIYTDEAALDVHRETPHFLKFGKAAEGMIVDRDIRKVTVRNPLNMA